MKRGYQEMPSACGLNCSKSHAALGVCSTCGTYMYKGTKFNTRKEDVEGETYLGIQVKCLP